MSELDDKLIDVLAEMFDPLETEVDEIAERIDETIPLIKQAFADAGYGLGASHIYNNKGAEQLCMTGQEFYNRFEKEVNKLQLPAGFELRSTYHAVEQINEAAKRAAGLTEEA